MNGRVTDEIEYLTADREENFLVAQANAPIDGVAISQVKKFRCVIAATSSKSIRQR